MADKHGKEIKPPIRDSYHSTPHPGFNESEVALPPFMTGDVAYFSADRTALVHYEDSPEFAVLWSDNRATDAADNLLEEVTYKQTFDAWLAVQNVEWKKKIDLKGSLLYLHHIKWRIDAEAKVDAARLVTPKAWDPEILANESGSGAKEPSLSELIFYDARRTRTRPCP